MKSELIPANMQNLLNRDKAEFGIKFLVASISQANNKVQQIWEILNRE